MAMHGYTWLYASIHGNTWLYMTIHSYTRVYMASNDYSHTIMIHFNNPGEPLGYWNFITATGGPSSCYEINVTGSDQYRAYCVTFEFI